MNYEEEILDYVRQHPGCRIQDMVTGTKCAYTEIVGVIEDMIDAGQLERWYSFGTPYFYIPGTYTPPNLRESEASGAELRKLIPLAAGLHRDGTIHIYVSEEDSGLGVGLLDDGTLIVKVAGSKRAMVAGKA